MAAPIVYRWDDGNAPVARGERRSLCDILYACLVTGYGSKPGAGWTREYVNATFDKAAFRNNPLTGTGFYLRVDGAGTANAYTSNVQAFEAMTSVDDGLFPFNASQQTMATSTAANTTARPWVLIADDRFFYLVIWTFITGAPGNADNMVANMGFGDGVSRYGVDSYCCLLTANGGGYGTYGLVMSPGNATGNLGSNGLAMPRKASGAAGAIMAVLIRGGGPGVADSSTAGSQGLAYVAGDQILVSRPHINEAAAYTFRGWMPGLYYPCHPMAFGQLATITVGEKNFLSFRHYVGQGGIGNLFISLDDWRA